MLYGMGHKRHERYWQRFLLPGESVIHTFGVSGVYVFLFWVLPMLLLLGGAVMIGLSNIVLGVMLVVPVLGLLVPALYLTYFVHYAITDRRTMMREGILNKHFVTVDYRSITDVTVRESLLERIFTRTGSIGVNTAGSNRVELGLRHVARPMAIKADIYKHLRDSLTKA